MLALGLDVLADVLLALALRTVVRHALSGQIAATYYRATSCSFSRLSGVAARIRDLRSRACIDSNLASRPRELESGR